MLLTLDQVAEILQVKRTTVLKRIDDGTLTAIRIGRKTIRIEEEELKRFIEEKKGHRHESTSRNYQTI